ncbi:MAG TPA: hypothetical protein VKS81_11790 [Bacteroidota bacterium]|nr:hypothetical protein [Bacteroidota bacterium]
MLLISVLPAQAVSAFGGFADSIGNPACPASVRKGASFLLWKENVCFTIPKGWNVYRNPPGAAPADAEGIVRFFLFDASGVGYYLGLGGL